MNDMPDYSSYSLEDLYDVYDQVDRDNYPERFKIICKEIEKRKSEKSKPVEEKADDTEKLRYRTFWPRFWAGFVDGLVFLPLGLLNDYIWANNLALPVIILTIWSILYSMSYYIYSILMHGYYGQTLGKMATKVKVFDISGEKLSLKQALMRDLIPIIFLVIAMPFEIPLWVNSNDPNSLASCGVFFTILISINMIWFLTEIITMLSNKKRRALHDFIAGSVVERI